MSKKINLTEEEKQKILKLKNENKNVKSIQKEINRSRSCIYKFLKEIQSRKNSTKSKGEENLSFLKGTKEEY